MASDPRTSWETEVEKAEPVTDFPFCGSKFTIESYKIRRQLLLGRKTLTNLECMLKSEA